MIVTTNSHSMTRKSIPALRRARTCYVIAIVVRCGKHDDLPWTTLWIEGTCVAELKPRIPEPTRPEGGSRLAVHGKQKRRGTREHRCTRCFKGPRGVQVVEVGKRLSVGDVAGGHAELHVGRRAAHNRRHSLRGERDLDARRRGACHRAGVGERRHTSPVVYLDERVASEGSVL